MSVARSSARPSKRRSAQRTAPIGIQIVIEEAYLYCPIWLLMGYANNLLAIGVYLLIARLFLIWNRAIPLSPADIAAFTGDSASTIENALQRLVRDGWLIAHKKRGKKTAYLPTWGNATQPWKIGAKQLGKPNDDLKAVRIPQILIDDALGTLIPHAIQRASIRRRVVAPCLQLADLGSYGRMLIGFAACTPVLERIGAASGRIVLPVAVLETQLRAIQDADQAAVETLQREVEQRLCQHTEVHTKDPGTLTDKNSSEFTLSQWDKTVLSFSTKCDPRKLTDTTELNLLTTPYPRLAEAASGGGDVAIQNREEEPEGPLTRERGETTSIEATDRSHNHSTETIPTDQNLPRAAACSKNKRSKNSTGAAPIPDTPTAQALRAINVRSRQIIELADLPHEQVAQVIEAARERDGIKDLAGWVVSQLRDVRDHGWQPERHAPRHAPQTDWRDYVARCPERWALSDDEPAPDVLERAETAQEVVEPEDRPKIEVAEHLPSETVLAALSDNRPNDEADAPPQTLEQTLREELGYRVRSEQRALLARLIIEVRPDTILLVAQSRADFAAMQQHILVIASSLVRQIAPGRSLRQIARAPQPSVAVAPPQAQGPALERVPPRQSWYAHTRRG